MLNRCIRASLILLAAASAITVAHGYALSGHKWTVDQVPYYINPTNNDVSESAAIAAIQTAASAWSMQTNASVSFYYMGRTSATAVSNDGKNEVFFRHGETSGSIGQTFRWWDGSGRLLDTDVVLYDDSWKFFAGMTGCSGGYYIEEIAVHEFGHALGLDHSSVSTATMYPGAYQCATWKSSLDPDDIAAVESVYPPSGTTTDTAPSVTVSSPGNDSSFTQGTTVTFSGSATDKEDGNLSAGIAWRSSIDGAIGTGASVSRVLSAGTHTITAQVVDSGGMAATKTLSVTVAAPANTAPTVTISTPSNNASFVQGTSVTMSGSASDAEDGNLTTKIAWTSSIDGSLGAGGSVSKVLSLGTHVITAQVSDSNGAAKSASITVVVKAPVNSPPTVTISSPSNGASFGAGSTVTFTGSASDAEDGTLSSSIVWSSSIDGPLGMGSSVSRTLSSGSHTITAQVSDKAGATVSKTIGIMVSSSTSSTAFTLSAKGSKTKGKLATTLSWKGATASSIDVYRNGSVIATVANTGGYTDNTGISGKATFTYQVCNAGTSTCSASVSVKF
jgi:hypothetical protein